MSDLNGQTIVNYKVTNIFAEDRLGVLYEASDMRNRASILLRVVHPELAQASFQQYFLKQATRLKALSHEGIVPVLDADFRDSHLYLAMKWVSDLTLEAYLKRELSTARALNHTVATRIARQLAETVHYAHQQKVEHYGLSPKSILISEPKPTAPIASIFEFGFDPIIDQYGLTSIEPYLDPIALRYIAPEQCISDKLDARTDIYALGCIMYELFTGRTPFSPQNYKEATRMHKDERPSRPSSLLPNLPAELETELDRIVLRCLAKDRLERYQNAGELARALSDFENIRPVVVAAPPPSTDYLIISTNGKTVQSIEIKKDSLIIGRKLEGQGLADVGLEGAKISRKHARLDRLANGSYEITDLGADNGTWINNVRLEPNAPMPLAFDTSVRINIYDVLVHRGTPEAKVSTRQGLPGGETRLERESDPVIPVVPPVKSVPPSQPTAQPAPTVSLPPTTDQSTDDSFVDISNKIKLILSPRLLEITAGGPQATLVVEIINNSEFVDHFPLEIVGLPTEWIQIPETAKLMPGKQERREIKLQVPPLSTSRAGIHLYQVRTKGEQHLKDYKEFALANGEIRVKPFYLYDAELHPTILRVTNRTQLEIANRGNDAAIYTLSGFDQEDALRFDFGAESNVKVPAGESVMRGIRVTPKNRPLIGMGRRVEFTIRSSTPNIPETKKITGGAIIWPFIPLPLLLLLAILFGLLALTDFDGDGLQNYQEILSGTCRSRIDIQDTDNDTIHDKEDAAPCLTSTPTITPTPGPTPTLPPIPTLGSQTGVPDCYGTQQESPLFDNITGKTFLTGKVLATSGNHIRDGKVDEEILTLDPTKIFATPLKDQIFTILSKIPKCAKPPGSDKQLRWWKVEYDGPDNKAIGWMAETHTDDTIIVAGVDPAPSNSP